MLCLFCQIPVQGAGQGPRPGQEGPRPESQGKGEVELREGAGSREREGEGERKEEERVASTQEGAFEYLLHHTLGRTSFKGILSFVAGAHVTLGHYIGPFLV